MSLLSGWLRQPRHILALPPSRHSPGALHLSLTTFFQHRFRNTCTQRCRNASVTRTVHSQVSTKVQHSTTTSLNHIGNTVSLLACMPVRTLSSSSSKPVGKTPRRLPATTNDSKSRSAVALAALDAGMRDFRKQMKKHSQGFRRRDRTVTLELKKQWQELMSRALQIRSEPHVVELCSFCRSLSQELSMQQVIRIVRQLSMSAVYRMLQSGVMELFHSRVIDETRQQQILLRVFSEVCHNLISDNLQESESVFTSLEMLERRFHLKPSHAVAHTVLRHAASTRSLDTVEQLRIAIRTKVWMKNHQLCLDQVSVAYLVAIYGRAGMHRQVRQLWQSLKHRYNYWRSRYVVANSDDPKVKQILEKQQHDQHHKTKFAGFDAAHQSVSDQPANIAPSQPNPGFFKSLIPRLLRMDLFWSTDPLDQSQSNAQSQDTRQQESKSQLPTPESAKHPLSPLLTQPVMDEELIEDDLLMHDTDIAAPSSVTVSEEIAEAQREAYSTAALRAHRHALEAAVTYAFEDVPHQPQWMATTPQADTSAGVDIVDLADVDMSSESSRLPPAQQHDEIQKVLMYEPPDDAVDVNTMPQMKPFLRSSPRVQPNALIRMQQLKPRAFVFAAMARVCADANDMEELHHLRNEMTEFNIQPELTLYTTLIDAYAAAQEYDNVDKLLAELESAGIKPDTQLMNTLIRSQIRTGQIEKVTTTIELARYRYQAQIDSTTVCLLVECIVKIRQRDSFVQLVEALITAARKNVLRPTAIASVLRACGAFGTVQLLRKFKRVVLGMRGSLSPIGKNALVYSLGECEEWAAMEAELDHARDLTSLTFATAMRICRQKGRFDSAARIFNKWQQRSNLEPHVACFHEILLCCARQGKARQVVEYWRKMIAAGIIPHSPGLWQTLMSVFGARRRYDLMERVWQAIISLAEGDATEALAVVPRKRRHYQVKGDKRKRTATRLLVEVIDLAMFETAQAFEKTSVRQSLSMLEDVDTTLQGALSRHSRSNVDVNTTRPFSIAQQAKRQQHRLRLSSDMLNARINAYLTNGEPELALDVYDEMQSLGLSPTMYTCSLVLRSFARSKKPNEMWTFWKEQVRGVLGVPLQSNLLYVVLLCLKECPNPVAFKTLTAEIDAELIAPHSSDAGGSQLEARLFNHVISVCLAHDYVRDAKEWLRKMQDHGIREDAATQLYFSQYYVRKNRLDELNWCLAMSVEEPHICPSFRTLQVVLPALMEERRYELAMQWLQHLRPDEVTPDHASKHHVLLRILAQEGLIQHQLVLLESIRVHFAGFIVEPSIRAVLSAAGVTRIDSDELLRGLLRIHRALSLLPAESHAYFMERALHVCYTWLSQASASAAAGHKKKTPRSLSDTYVQSIAKQLIEAAEEFGFATPATPATPATQTIATVTGSSASPTGKLKGVLAKLRRFVKTTSDSNSYS
jgi:pentatricopeptide repeat protein